LPVEYLTDQESAAIAPKPNLETQIERAKTAWHAPLIAPKTDLKNALQPILERYKLSATHLNNFLDVASGGPEFFLMNNLLHFPVAKSAQAHFGTAVHAALQRAHTHLTDKNVPKPLEDILGDFAESLGQANLTARDFDFYQKKGVDALTNFYDKRGDSFTPTQRAEYSFTGENIVVDGARLTGMIDLIHVDRDNKIIRPTDYKTGKPATDWRGKTDYEKIKLRKYRQQLLFYKLLIENSREFAGFKVEQGVLEFVEPLSNGEVAQLTINYDELGDEWSEFLKLITKVWQKIINFDLPNIDAFSHDFNGMIEFEKFLFTE
jgi:DNA helicase-2/ATP-dependent DNA helicase PcrA